MPFYEYQCQDCSHELEAMQRVSDTPLKKCPRCGKSRLKRLISAPVFRLKGGGWYETDFKDDKDKKRNLADHPSAADKEADKKVEVKADSGSEAKKPEGADSAKKTDSVKGSESASKAGSARRKTPKAKRKAKRRA
jgi:putative FmdB family regulatory protein